MELVSNADNRVTFQQLAHSVEDWVVAPLHALHVVGKVTSPRIALISKPQGLAQLVLCQLKRKKISARSRLALVVPATSAVNRVIGLVSAQKGKPKEESPASLSVLRQLEPSKKMDNPRQP